VTLANPCTKEAIEKEQFYHAYPLDCHFYVQCDQSGFPHLRPCPPTLVWSAEETTCVREPDDTPTTTTARPGVDDKWKYVMTMGGAAQQHPQQNGNNMQGMVGSWQSSDVLQPWPADVGSSMNNMQQWMVSYALQNGQPLAAE